MATSPSTEVILDDKPYKPVYHDYLPANTEEARRLRIQYEVIQRTFGNVILHVPVDLGVPNAAVLDSGTGLGIWLLDLAGTIPAATELIGIDIQSSLFPDTSSVPSNISFKVVSVLELPPTWDNKFALANQRLLFIAFDRAEWSKVLKNLYRVIQPGGWLQLLEADQYFGGGPMLQLYSLLWKNMLESRDIHGSWPNGSRMWRQLVEEAGFIDIQVSWYETPIGKWAGKDGIDMKESLMGGAKAARVHVIKNEGFCVVPGEAERYDQWVRSLEKEVDQGVDEPKIRWVMICARKPHRMES